MNELPAEPASQSNPEVGAVEDRELMQRVQRGDESALGLLMQRWELPVKAVIARVVLNASEAEELAQETFVRLWQQRAKYRTEAEFRPWILTIALNLARNRLRWWRRRPVVSLEQWTQSGDRKGEEDARAAESAGTRPLERAERAAAVRDAVAALPMELREAVVLFEYERLPQAEIAEILGITPKAVETRIYRGREKLRATLKAWM